MSENVEKAEDSKAPVKARKAKKPKGMMIIIIVVSIILILGAVISLYLNSIAWALIELTGTEFAGLLAVDMIASTVSVIVDIIGGLLGLIFCAKASKAGIVITSGVIMIIFALYGILIDAVNDASLTTSSVIMSVLFPMLYTIGGILNRKSAKT
ncbi:MAG: hypothetical protein K6C41_05200 [Lachnospiraceae bacterium]|nr:hypothetical protein [Lachnospiraceae bacterium]